MTSSGGAETAQRRVLVVEDRAHWPSGHFPTRFAELAEGFAENGCIVEVLTSQGWLQDGERAVPFVVNRYGRLDSILYRAGEALRRTRGLQGVSSALRTLAVVRAARARYRKTGDPTLNVVVVSMGIDPLVGSAFAKRGNWLFYEFGNPSRLLRRLAKRAARNEARRRLSGGRARIATPNVENCGQWAEIAPFLDPVTLPLTGVRPCNRVPDARRRLGLDDHDKVALVFGAEHNDKDIDVVARVFAELPDWQLVVVGWVADAYRQRAGGREAIVMGGYVDNSIRDIVYSAADIVVLSFRPGYLRNSGVLTDAISMGVPVVCSDESIAADVVREYRLGSIFDPGNPDSLERAIKATPASVDPADLDRARKELSNRAVSARFLDALHYSPRAEGGQQP
jgi:glycosyltransferase involved in cell wall biosynthesis